MAVFLFSVLTPIVFSLFPQISSAATTDPATDLKRRQLHTFLRCLEKEVINVDDKIGNWEDLFDNNADTKEIVVVGFDRDSGNGVMSCNTVIKQGAAALAPTDLASGPSESQVRNWFLKRLTGTTFEANGGKEIDNGPIERNRQNLYDQVKTARDAIDKPINALLQKRFLPLVDFCFTYDKSITSALGDNDFKVPGLGVFNSKSDDDIKKAVLDAFTRVEKKGFIIESKNVYLGDIKLESWSGNGYGFGDSFYPIGSDIGQTASYEQNAIVSCAFVEQQKDIIFANVTMGSDGKLLLNGTVVGTLPNAPNSTASTGDADVISCEAEGISLSWILCPVISGVQNLVGKLNDVINDLMTLPTDKFFDTTNSNVANQFYEAWSGFRYIAMGLLVIIALIMVLSQAIGVGPFDAYTIRKVLPRLLAAVVLISLSWPLMKLAVDITNGVGHSVSGLIYGPFSDSLTKENPSLTIIGGALLGVVAGAFVFGVFGALAFVATAALSMLSGVATLIFREMLIMFLVVVAPVAIICSILPNTQTLWKKWSDYFLRALIVFPIFSGVIAIGQVFASIGPTLNGKIVGTLIQFVGYFGPYFMLPKIFAMSGGAVAAVGSVAQKATAGMRGGLSNYRKKKAGTRVTNAGARLKSGDFLSRRLDRYGGNRVNDRLAGVAGGAKEGYGFGRRSETAKAARALRRKDESAKNKDLENLGVNNDMGTAIMALSHGTNAGAVAASHALRTNSLANNAAYQNADESTVAGAATRRRIEAEAEVSRVNGLAAARNVGFSRGNAQYALTAMAKSKSRAIGAIGGHELIQGGINGLSSSAEEAIQMKNDFAFNSSGAGRADFASSGNWTDEHGVAATDRVLDGFERTGLYAAANGHQNSVVAAENEALALLSTGVVSNEDMQRVAIHRRELAAMLPNANGPVRDAINHSIANLGGNAALRNWESLQAMDPATGAPPVDPATGAPITVRQPIDIARVDRNSPKFDPVYAGQYERAEIQRGYSERPETNGEVAQRMARAYERPNPNNPE